MNLIKENTKVSKEIPNRMMSATFALTIDGRKVIGILNYIANNTGITPMAFGMKVKHVHGGCTGPRMQTTRILGSLLACDVIENYVEINKKILREIEDKIIATSIQTQKQQSLT